MMFSQREMPSPSSIFSAYASMLAFIMLLRSIAHQLIPEPIREYLINTFHYIVKPRSTLTLIIEESSGITCNEVFDAAETYLSTKVTLENERLKIGKAPKEKKLTIRLEKGEKLTDIYNGFALIWRFICFETEKNSANDMHNNNNSISVRSEKKYFELSFHKKYKEIVFESYLPFILDKAKEMKDEERVLKMHTLDSIDYDEGVRWDSINLEHPSTFETLAMEPEMKNLIIEDLNMFVKRREFYKKVGRAWKRGYLLYGPPGTGKSSLIAAMANYLKFDIYDLQFGTGNNFVRNYDLRKVLLATANRSIFAIEDIDCSVDIPKRRQGEGRKQNDIKLTLSELLNIIDGLWSSCGDERIIIFTTNHKEKLDPALLRPGRMDMHIHMTYCSYEGFKILASNYLEISHDNPFFGEIEGLIKDIQITPAQVAEELMKKEDAEAEAMLEEFVKLLKQKKMAG